MRHNKLALFLHLVWATWNRLPVIVPELERPLLREIASEAQGKGCTVLAIGAMPDHVHLLVTLPATMPVSELVKQVKGVSSHFVNEVMPQDALFRRQGHYGAFTVSKEKVELLVEYITQQKDHHESGDLVEEWEQSSEDVATPVTR